ncbi:MAG: extracellular solute-binding protein [Anaerolineae bacterium]|nr:extracellular solute-binding protein [Anaerolineae bacterium]
MLRKRSLLMLLVTALVAGLFPIGGAGAQESIILSLSLPDYMQQNFPPELFAPFEAETGVRVEVIGGEYPFIPNPALETLDRHFEALEEYVSSADVLFVVDDFFSVEATRAGYLLNLMPLAAVDPDLRPEDFLPAAWQAFQWDGGLWALPAAVDVVTLQYVPEMFDAAGLAYPNAQWTLDDLTRAARALVQYDGSGKTTVSGILALWSYYYLLFRALTGTALYDSATLPETPRLTGPAVEAVATAWQALEEEGVTDLPPAIMPGSMPLSIDTSFSLQQFGGDIPQVIGAYLPGGVAGLRVTGFAVSGGAAHPEAAYQLARYLTQNAQAVYGFFAYAPARRSLMGLNVADAPMSFGTYSPENKAFLDEALTRALSPSELRYSAYLDLAIILMGRDLDAPTALAEAEATAVANLQAADARRAEVTIYVEPVEAPPELAPGESALRFGMQTFTGPILDESRLAAAADAFAASDPEVGYIDLAGNPAMPVEQLAAETDCFLLSYNAVPGIDPQLILNLDPFIDADPGFDRAGIMARALDQVQRDNKTWALPIAIEPAMLRYDAEQFAQAGLPLPEYGWETTQFTDALRALKAGPDSPPPFIAPAFNQTYILMLIAAYGGLPIDYRTDPPTVNFTDPANAEAIRQVLDLALEDYIGYEKLNILGLSGGGGGGGGPESSKTEAIYPDTVNLFRISYWQDPDTPYKTTTYPRGSQYTPVLYQLHTGYISAAAQNPAACYRWINYLAQQPDLLSAMPARRSLLDDPVLAAAHTGETVAFYRAFDALTQAPNTVIFRASMSGMDSSVGEFYAQQWLFRAMDRHVLEGADLDAELADAQNIYTAYLGCEASIPPYDPATYTDRGEYLGRFHECAGMADPDL